MRIEKMPLKTVFWYALFALAMAYLESAVVVYLRLLYYPAGFQFPMIPIPSQIAIIETGREAATLIMIWAVARIGRNAFKERFTLFCFIFGIWDLAYYAWLYLFIGWPGFWLEWDILFLIPVPWIAPWLAPALVSIGLIGVSLTILFSPERFPESIFSSSEWRMVLFGGILILASFFWQTKNILEGGIPVYFPWPLFGIGYGIGIWPFLHHIRNKRPI